MSDRKVLITETHLEDIGDAIRERNGSQSTYTPGQMPAAIEAIPNAYAAGDEGKVVSNGELVAQTARTVTANGTYDTTANDEVTVSISGGATLVPKSITQNGTYNPADDNADGYSGVTVNVSSGGGVPLLTRSQWDELTKSQKQSYGLVAIQDSDSGFLRGDLVDGASYGDANIAEVVPIHSWNSSDNAVHTYNFTGTTLAQIATVFCLAVMEQNGNSPAWDASSNLKPALLSGTQGNGSYAVCYGAYSIGSFASTYSGGNNWNNSEIVCFEFSGDIEPTVIESFFAQGTAGTYTYTHTATESEKLLLICMRGGQSGSSYSISGLTQKSHVTSTGARFNDVYYGELSAGDIVNISIPHGSGQGSLLVVLLSVDL